MTQPFQYIEDDLFCETTSLADIASREGTPCYVYSATGILDRFRAYDREFGDVPHRVCYAAAQWAVEQNPALARATPVKSSRWRRPGRRSGTKARARTNVSRPMGRLM